MDAIGSVEKITDKSLYELIIVNDGSTDEYTNKLLKELSQNGYHVIFQENKGLATSRNNAISVSKGEYILPLDADNMIRPEYVYEAIKIFEEYKDISIVYADAELFGEERGRKIQYEYNLQRLMLYNTIDACAVYRRTVWEITGGYDKNMAAPGIEDWEMWLHASFKGLKFHYINKVLFDYRIVSNSMIRTLFANKIKGDANMEYLIAKHKDYFGPQYIDDDIMYKFSLSPIGFVTKIMLKRYFPRKFNKLVSAGKLRKYI